MSGPRSRPPLVLVLVAVALTLVALDIYGPGGSAVAWVRSGARLVLSPAEEAAAVIARPVGDVLRGAARGGSLAAENTRLRTALARATAESARAESLARENARLAELLGLTPGGDSRPPSVAARVVSVPDGQPGSTVVLDRGSESGIAPGMPVLVAGALAGRVVDASSGRAAVLPVTDPAFAVGIRLASTGEIGVARGRGPSGALAVEMLDPAAAGPTGDLAITSGFEHGRFPPGVPVGRVRSRDGDRAVRLEPLAPVTRLELVEVLQWSPE